MCKFEVCVPFFHREGNEINNCIFHFLKKAESTNLPHIRTKNASQLIQQTKGLPLKPKQFMLDK